MILTSLTDNSTLTLPDDLLWVDEHAWTPAVARIEYLLTGALLVETAARAAGRPITLQAEPDMAWVTRATVSALYAWASVPSRQFALTFQDGRSFTVAFRHFETAIEAAPVLGFPASGDDDFYRITLRLMEI